MQDFKYKVFYSVAKNLSFTKAAKELFITQPAVSKHIRELEKYFGLRLFDRDANKITLTPAGRTLLKHSEELLKIHRQIEFDLNLLKNQTAGNLRIGASTTIAQYVLPPLLARFHQAFPDIQLSLINDNTENIQRAVLQEHIDLGIIEGKSRKKELKYTFFLNDELVAITHYHSQLAHLQEISLQALSRYPLVLRERGSGTLEVIEDALQQEGLSLSDLQIAMYLGSTESIKSYLAHANCIGIVSISSISKDLLAGKFKLIEFKDFSLHRTFEFVRNQGDSQGLAAAFMDYARQNHNF
ncbi:LysR family transcriptional regulator [Rapidithrix thailandica]|uniref:LysR family transcriptional regulator n=1 Tax=Rapidithrix thailandica TaxID=413964 RepID=A0AAW9S795_9BACT